MKNAVVLLVFVILGGAAIAQYVREGPIGTVKPTAQESKNPYPTIPFQQWVGKRIIILPNRRLLQQSGYTSFNTVGLMDYMKSSTTIREHCSYSECAGKTARVIAISRGITTEVTIEMEETRRRFVIDGIYEDTIDHIALLDDLDRARSEFIGKTLWVKEGYASTYDSAGNFGTIQLPKWGPVKVVDVIAGDSHDEPTRFLVENDRREQGAIDVHMSDTNVTPLLAKYNGFDFRFLLTDPRPRYNISPRIWQQIEREQIIVGMTKEEVILSRGEPHAITKTVAQSTQGETVRAGKVTRNFTGADEQWEYHVQGLHDTKVTLLQFKAGRVSLVETSVR